MAMLVSIVTMKIRGALSKRLPRVSTAHAGRVTKALTSRVVRRGALSKSGPTVRTFISLSYPRLTMSDSDIFPFVHPKQSCPRCGYNMDSMMPAEGHSRAPRAGDHSVCMECGQLLEFTGEGIVLGDATSLSVENAQLVFRVQQAIKNTKQRRKNRDE